MSQYVDFVRDFPRRCRDVLELASDPAYTGGREVTLLIMAASAGLVVPYERLKSGKNESHHPQRDREEFPSVAEELDQLTKSNFLKSELWGREPCSWLYGRTDSVEEQPEEWPGYQRRKKPNDKTVEFILCVLRNALAHGNIFSLGDDRIDRLLFYKENRDRNTGKRVDFSFIEVTPRDFREFLGRWFDFLGEVGPEAREVAKYLQKMEPLANAA